MMCNALTNAGRIVIGLYGQVVPKTVGMSLISQSNSLVCYSVSLIIRMVSRLSVEILQFVTYKLSFMSILHSFP